MKTYINEEGYLELLSDLLKIEHNTPERTGNGSIKFFAPTLYFPDISKAFPLFTSRPVPFRLCFEEMQLFLRGQTDTNLLEKKGIKFWMGNTRRKFLDNRGLKKLPQGNMGYAYGAIIRHVGGVFNKYFEPSGGIDQLAYVYNALKKDIWDRRAIIELWIPQHLNDMALTPCCHTYNFSTTMGDDGKPELNLAITIRSSDVVFGLGGANAPQFGYLLTAMAKLLKVRPKALALFLVDPHIYSGTGKASQIEYAKEAVTRSCTPLPQIEIKKELNNLDDLTSLTIDDIAIHNYKPNEEPMRTVRPEMAV